MDKEEFDALKIGVKVKVIRRSDTPPICGTLADRVDESALIKTGYTPSGKPILRWAHYMSLKIMEVEK